MPSCGNADAGPRPRAPAPPVRALSRPGRPQDRGLDRSAAGPRRGRVRRRGRPAPGPRRPGLRLQQRQQALQQLGRRRRAAGDQQVHWQRRADAALHRGAALEDAAVPRAVAGGDHPFRRGRAGPGPVQRFAHVAGERAGDQQHVGVAGRGDEAQPEALQDVDHAGQGVDLQLAAVAGAGVHLPDRQAAAEPPLRRGVEPLDKGLYHLLRHLRRRVGERLRDEVAGEARPEHDRMAGPIS